MAVSTTDTYSGPYAANGVTVEFPFTFKAVSGDDVGVFIRDAAGIDTIIDSTAYSVTLSAEGGTVAMTAPPTAGEIYIFSDPSFLQPVSFASGQAFLPTVVNEVNDRDVVRALYLKREIDRAPKTPLGGGAEGQFPVVGVGGGWGFASGTGNDPAFRADVASSDPDKGAALMAYRYGGQAGTVSEKLSNLASPNDVGFGADRAGITNSLGAFSLMFAAAAAFQVPSGSYKVDATPDMPADGFSWRKDAGAIFTGAGSLADPVNFPGFSYTADLRYIQMAEVGASAANPSTVSHPVAFYHQHSDAPGAINPAVVFQQNKWGSASQTGVQAAFFETVDRAGNAPGRTDFGEAIRAHAVGFGGNPYGAVLVAQIGDGVTVGTAKYGVACEMEVIRAGGTPAVLPAAWTSSNNFDACGLATVRYGVKAMAGFAINPFNEVRAQVGFGVFNSFAAQGVARRTIDFASFFSNENDVPYGLYLRNIGYASISIDNNKPIMALNAAGDAEHNVFYYGTDNAVHIGAGATGVVMHGEVTLAGVTLLSSPGLSSILGAPTGSFWLDVGAEDVKIQRLGQRVFVGSAFDNTGNLLGTQGGTFAPTAAQGPNWLLQYGTAVVQSPGLQAVVGVSRSSDGLFTGFPIHLQAAIGVSGAAINDVANAVVWGLYGDVQLKNAGVAYGLEIAAKNSSYDRISTPYLDLDGVFGIWLAGGGDATYAGAPTAPNNAAVRIGYNSSTWNTGLLFDKLGITGTDGITGVGTAIALARGHSLLWFKPDGSPGARLHSEVDASGQDVAILLSNNKVQLLGSAGVPLVIGQHVTNGVNGLLVTDGTAGNGPILSPTGASTDADLNLAGKGTGMPRFGVLAASGDAAITGYVDHKLADGSIVRLAVIA